MEEQALLREKLEIKPTWKKGKDPAVKRKTQPMVSDIQVAAIQCMSLVSLDIGHFSIPKYLNGNNRFYTHW